MIRRIVQIIGSVLSNSYFPVIATKTIYRGTLKGVCVPLLNCYACPLAVASCPIGTIQYFMATSRIPYYVIGYLGLIGVAVGRMACGWVCPFGFFQDLMSKIKTRKFRLPAHLGYVKYVALVLLVLLIPYLTHEHWFSRLCPWGTVEASIPWGLWNPKNPSFLALTPSNAPIRETIGGPYYLKIGILIGFLGLMLFFKRPFCFMVCPLGAIFSLFNRVSIFRLSVDIDKCTGCDQCYRRCPMGLKVYETPNSPDCIRCLECTKCEKVEFYSIFGEKPHIRDTTSEAGW